MELGLFVHLAAFPFLRAYFGFLGRNDCAGALPLHELARLVRKRWAVCRAGLLKLLVGKGLGFYMFFGFSRIVLAQLVSI